MRWTCVRPHAQLLPKLDILAELAQAGFCNVDLAPLDTDDIVLKHEAVRQNRLVYQTDDFDRRHSFPGLSGGFGIFGRT